MPKLPPRLTGLSSNFQVRSYPERVQDRPDERLESGPAVRTTSAATERQLAHIDRLLQRKDLASLTAKAREALGRFHLNDGMCSFSDARTILDELTKCPDTYQGATDAQVDHVLRLAARLGVPMNQDVAAMTRSAASKLIDQLKDQLYNGGVVPEVTTTTKVMVGEGLYLFNGDVIQVIRAVHGSGKLYTKKMFKLAEPVEQRDGRLRLYGFERVIGVMGQLRPEMRMNAEQTSHYGKLYGCCIRCGLTLTRDESKDRMMGPVCYAKQHGDH